MKHVRRKGKAIVYAVVHDLKVLMGRMPDCQEEN